MSSLLFPHLSFHHFCFILALIITSSLHWSAFQGDGIRYWFSPCVMLLAFKTISSEYVTWGWNLLARERMLGWWGGGRIPLARAGELGSIVSEVARADPVLSPVGLMAPLLLSVKLHLECLLPFHRTELRQIRKPPKCCNLKSWWLPWKPYVLHTLKPVTVDCVSYPIEPEQKVYLKNLDFATTKELEMSIQKNDFPLKKTCVSDEQWELMW